VRGPGDGIDRRQLLAGVAVVGVASSAGATPTLGGHPAKLTDEVIAACDRFAGLDFTAAERQQMLATVDEQLDRLRALRSVRLENQLAPAVTFDPRLPGWTPRPLAAEPAPAPTAPPLPATAEDIAFAPAWQQAAWIAGGKLTCRALVDLYLDRVARLGPDLLCFVTVTPDRARAEAAVLDREVATGRLRGPLHGLPYGLKDLFDTAGIRTTWGAEPYRGRVPTQDAAIVSRLRAAGAVLIGKTSCGAIAFGDIWFGGRTRNPWNRAEGSSGSSAGSASAVAAGLCAFGIGTETMGSIVAPSARCGAVGLRPSFGRVARTGGMALCWSYDKVGAIARTVADAGMVVRAINGADVGDAGSIDLPFGPTPAIDPHAVTLGYRAEWFDKGLPTDRAALAAARSAGFRLVEIAMPDIDLDLLGGLVVTEAAAAFEDLTLDGRDDMLRWQDDPAWPNSWRAARFEPAIGYVQAQRLRRRLMMQFAGTMRGVDAILHANSAGGMIGIGNHTGYPALVIPAGFLDQPTRTGFASHLDVPAGTPASALHHVPFTVTLTGHLFDEPRLLAIGGEIERRLAGPARRPPA
jgi:Asp-tRNA(Asn)/Glu-tRNA(Gln) amidotransferase A subunit family amidase